MKIFFLSFLLAFFALGAIAQDTIPNAGFEFWTQGGPDYVDPNGWQTLNSQTDIISILTCLRDSGTVHSGKYSVKLVTKSGAGFIIPGILSTGQIHQSGAIDDGIPMSSRPTSLNGWYKYNPVSNDTATFSISLTKAGSPIGAGAISVRDTADWTYFSVPVTYSSGNTPDSVQLLFFSGTNQSSHLGSTMWIDDLSYGYTNGIVNVAADIMKIYPNPANNQVTIDNGSTHALSLNIYSCLGQLVKEVKLSEGVNTIDVSLFSQGLYLISAAGDDGSIYRNSLVIQK